MSGRTLPPPPPPFGVRAWPDRTSLLADRARAMAELHRMSIGGAVLVQLWLLAAGFAVGWVLIASALRTFVEAIDPLSQLFGGVLLLLGAAFVVPTGLLIGFGLARDAKVRRLLRAWSSLDSDPAGDARFASPGLSLTWFLPSFLMCAGGLWSCFAVPAGAEPGQDTVPGVVLLMGLGMILWLTGLIGVSKAVGHYRWALRLVPRRAAAGARA
ncbi:hypothetical protein HW130_07630 [Streptomyces sp. PKU-EA00015]|uniref:hypothetical protein n=1 Tax=Streptomyces sp. PKU-EA00015 TaxID=2748326 RepID=UPI0015A4D810|nr:hypothetical protein [Streptomyces sp. PKU-EA00015]NWF26140.1 hypothetical protein [Streptomyces sp. PKU-EA00015]